MRMILGLVAPTAGEALVNGMAYRNLAHPRREVGAVLDGPGAHPAHGARTHLTISATAAGLPVARVGEVLELVELTEHARRPAGAFSMGMRQRLALATAMLGDPGVLILDEPVNGLDPPGIIWMRDMTGDPMPTTEPALDAFRAQATPQPAGATGETAELYDQLREAFFGFVPDVFKLVSARPDMLRVLVDGYTSMFAGGLLPREATGVGAGALGQGDQAPDFTLPDHLGRPVRLADLLAAGPVVLSFYRGRGARSATSSSPALGRYHDRIIALGATLVAVSPEPPDLAGSLVDRHSLAFPVLFGRRQRGGRLLPAGDDDP